MTGAAMRAVELAERLGLALALAVFLGLAFEEVYKREERAVPGGVRTFPMLTLAGAMLYLIEPQNALGFIAGLLAVAIWLFAFVRNAPAAVGAPTLMVPASNLLAYVIGPIALAEPPWVAVAVSVTAVLLLSAREKLHRLVRIVPQDELLTAGEFVILVGVILPLVPDHAVTDLTPLTPYHVWLAVVAICALSYASYLVQRYLPMEEDALLPAVLGGVYSSTATTVVLSKRQREAGTARPDLSAGIVAATAIMYLRLGAIVAIFDWRLFLALAPALLALFLVGAALTGLEWRRFKASGNGAGLAMAAINPLELPTATVFAALFVVISVASSWVASAFGTTGVLSFAAVVGVTDIDPFVLSIAQGGVTGVPPGALEAAIIVAASSNNLVKAGYAIAFGGFAAMRRTALLLTALALAGFAAAVIYAR